MSRAKKLLGEADAQWYVEPKEYTKLLDMYNDFLDAVSKAMRGNKDLKKNYGSKWDAIAADLESFVVDDMGGTVE